MATARRNQNSRTSRCRLRWKDGVACVSLSSAFCLSICFLPFTHFSFVRLLSFHLFYSSHFCSRSCTSSIDVDLDIPQVYLSILFGRVTCLTKDMTCVSR